MAAKPAPNLPGRWYASSGAVVTNTSQDLVLSLLRPQRLDRSGNPEVRLPKGEIDSDEARLPAALREVAEEAGLSGLLLLADLGHQVVEFDWKGFHYTRDESCFLLALTASTRISEPEQQFQRLWLTWDEALARLTYQAERQWVERARRAAASLPAGNTT